MPCTMHPDLLSLAGLWNCPAAPLIFSLYSYYLPACAQARLGKLSGAMLVGTYALVAGAYALFGQMAREDLPDAPL